MDMPFGKHKGTPVSDLPKRYLQWLEGNVAMRGELKAEVHRLLHGTTPPPAGAGDAELAATVGTFDDALAAMQGK